MEIINWILDNPVKTEEVVIGSLIVILGVIVFINTFRSTRDRWVLLNITLVVICNVAYVAKAWG